MNSTTEASELSAENLGELKYSRTIADLSGPKGLPFLGNALQMSGRQWHLSLAKWVREFRPIFRLTVPGGSVVVVSDRATAGALLRERPEQFRRVGGLKTIMNELNISGVFIAEGDDWRKQRKLVMGGLNAEVIRNFFPKMSFMAERMLRRWKTALAEGRPVDLRRDLKAFALDVTVGIAMGHDLDVVNHDGSQLQRDVDNMFQRLGARAFALFPYWRHFKLPADREADKSAANIEQTVAGFIRNTRARMEQQPHLRQKPTTMLEAMIAASDDPESGFTDQDLINNAILSVIGGEDTTANTMAWMINLLAQNPDAASALAAEADAVLDDAELAHDWEMMKQFPYLDAAHNETQRLRTVAPFIGIVSNADCVVADTFVPKNTAIMVSTAGEGLDEAQFPQNDAFLPERWIFDQKPQKEDDPARKLIPFGDGPRLCPGRFLALTEIKLVISMVMHNFELEFDTHAPPIQQIMNFFMSPSAVPVRLKLRS
ncbi:cytochrome P450 [Dyella humi]|uniref:Cytochrome P450 n=1 Tax=Dyella humi TaxID=1770547 RepID=A0ABW8IDF9_9GAMM